MKENGYRWWLDRLRRAFSLYDRVRLDHFLGFHSYFSIPAGKACADGRWLAGPGKDLFQTAYDELGPLNFIAEDLGYLTPGVRAMASTCGFPGMDVLEFSDYDVRAEFTPHRERSCTPRRTTPRHLPAGARAPLQAAMSRAALHWQASSWAMPSQAMHRS